jgi:hypothetical protein
MFHWGGSPNQAPTVDEAVCLRFGQTRTIKLEEARREMCSPYIAQGDSSHETISQYLVLLAVSLWRGTFSSRRHGVPSPEPNLVFQASALEARLSLIDFPRCRLWTYIRARPLHRHVLLEDSGLLLEEGEEEKPT